MEANADQLKIDLKIYSSIYSEEVCGVSVHELEANDITVFVVKCEYLAYFLEAKNADLRRRGRKIKTYLLNVTRKDGAIDSHSVKRKLHEDVVENNKVRYYDRFSLTSARQVTMHTLASD